MGKLQSLDSIQQTLNNPSKFNSRRQGNSLEDFQDQEIKEAKNNKLHTLGSESDSKTSLDKLNKSKLFALDRSPRVSSKSIEKVDKSKQDKAKYDKFMKQFMLEVDQNQQSLQSYKQNLANIQQQRKSQSKEFKKQTVQNYLRDAVNQSPMKSMDHKEHQERLLNYYTQPSNSNGKGANQNSKQPSPQSKYAVQKQLQSNIDASNQSYLGNIQDNLKDDRRRHRRRDSQVKGRDVQESVRSVPRVKTAWRDKYMKLLVVGESGLGKTTFIRNLLMSYAQDPQFEVRDASAVTSANTFMENPSYYLTRISVNDDQAKIHYHYSVQDSPGYGDDLNLKLSLDRLVNFIESQYEKYFTQDMDPQRDTSWQLLEDPRVDAIIFFISPHRFKLIDEKMMQELGKLCPIIPVIAKADSMTPEEHNRYHQEIHSHLVDQSKDINIYNFPQEIAQDAGAIREIPPFSIVASNVVDPNGPVPYWPVRSVLIQQSGRQDQLYASRLSTKIFAQWSLDKYEWGTCEVLLCKHSDFSVLKRLIFEMCYEDLKQDTEKRYLAYRRNRLQAAMGQLIKQKSPQTQPHMFYPNTSMHGYDNSVRLDPQQLFQDFTDIQQNQQQQMQLQQQQQQLQQQSTQQNQYQQKQQDQINQQVQDKSPVKATTSKSQNKNKERKPLSNRQRNSTSSQLEQGVNVKQNCRQQ